MGLADCGVEQTTWEYHLSYLIGVEFYLYPTVSTALVHSVKPELTE